MIKRKEMIATIVVCVLLILGGIIGVSLCYQILFRPERIVEAEQSENNDWKSQKHAYETKVLYPFEAWKEDETIIELGGYKEYSDYYHQGGDTYTLMKELVGIFGIDSKELYDAKMIAYTFQTDTKEYEEYRLSYVLQLEMGENGEELIPVSYQYYRQKSESNEISQMTISKSAVPRDLQWIFEQLDDIYDQTRYWELTASMGVAAGLNAIPVGSMSVYTAYADWELYADDAMAAYVGIIGDYNFIFYYDKINNRICGFNFGMNAKR